MSHTLLLASPKPPSFITNHPGGQMHMARPERLAMCSLLVGQDHAKDAALTCRAIDFDATSLLRDDVCANR